MTLCPDHLGLPSEPVTTLGMLHAAVYKARPSPQCGACNACAACSTQKEAALAGMAQMPYQHAA